MSDEREKEIKEFASNLEKAWNGRDWDMVLSIHDEGFVDHTAPPGVEGLTNLKGLFELFGAAFPDFKIKVDDAFADDEKATWRWSLTGTHDGDFMGVPASGNKVSLSAITIARIQGGKCYEAWSVADMMSLMAQMGAM